MNNHQGSPENNGLDQGAAALARRVFDFARNPGNDQAALEATLPVIIRELYEQIIPFFSRAGNDQRRDDFAHLAGLLAAVQRPAAAPYWRDSVLFGGSADEISRRQKNHENVKQLRQVADFITDKGLYSSEE